jgi:hypothetical protein
MAPPTVKQYPVPRDDPSQIPGDNELYRPEDGSRWVVPKDEKKDGGGISYWLWCYVSRTNPRNQSRVVGIPSLCGVLYDENDANRWVNFFPRKRLNQGRLCPDCKGDGEGATSMWGAALPCPMCYGEGTY